jgi:hypothetical protein
LGLIFDYAVSLRGFTAPCFVMTFRSRVQQEAFGYDFELYINMFKNLVAGAGFEPAAFSLRVLFLLIYGHIL